MGRVAYTSDRDSRLTGYRSRSASGLRFARLTVLPAVGSGAVVRRRAEFLKEALLGGFGNGYVFSTDKL